MLRTGERQVRDQPEGRRASPHCGGSDTGSGEVSLTRCPAEPPIEWRDRLPVNPAPEEGGYRAALRLGGMGWGNRPRWAWWVMAGYVAGFLEGTGAHAYDVVTGGLHAYGYAPLALQLLFHALLLLDPLVALLVVTARPVGPYLGAAVMLADLAANWWLQRDIVLHHPATCLRPVGLLPITVFGVFVLATALPLRRVLVAAAR